MKKIVLIIIGVLLIIGVKSSMYVVYEDEVAILKTLGKVVAVIINPADEEIVTNTIHADNKGETVSIITTKGLKFKIPFLQNVEKYNAKNLTYKSASEVINTKDDMKIEISMYAQYRIVDPLKYKLTVATPQEFLAKMDNRVYPVVIQSANNLRFHEFFDIKVLNDMIVTKREELNTELVSDFGIYVTSIGINRKNFPESNIESIEQKMSMQIEKESEKLIAEGDSLFSQEKSKTDRQRVEVVSVAVEEAANIKAEADTEALKVYQDSLKKDVEFYRFIQRMDAYKEIKGKTLFLDMDNSFFNYLKSYN